MSRRTGVIAGTAVGAIGAAVLVLLLIAGVATPERGDSRPQRLPLGIPATVIAACESSAGLSGSAPVTAIWRDSAGLHVRVGEGTRYAVGTGSGSGSTATESALLSCLTLARGVQPAYPSDSAGLLLLWKYSTAVLWPCFEQHGVDVGPTPSRATFLRGDPLQIDPLELRRSAVSDELWLQVQRDCPLLPDYLATPTPAPSR